MVAQTPMTGPPSNTPKTLGRDDWVVVVGLCITIFLACLPLMMPPSMENLSGDYSDDLIDAGSVLFFILSAYLLTVPGTPDFKKLAYSIFAFSCLFLAGDIISSIHRDFLGGSPDLGPADILWDIGYFPLIFITYYTVWKNHEHLKMRTLFVVTVIWIAILVAVVMPAIVVSFVDTSNLLQTTVLSLGPPLDMILIFGFVLVILVYQEGRVLKYWLFLTGGFIAMALGDIIYLLIPTSQNYYLNALPNTFYSMCYPIMAIGVYYMITMPHKFQSIEPTGRYVISQVFVAHKKGTLLSHAMTKEAKRCVDPDIMVGMLTAIQDFVRESFEGDKQQRLDELKYGDMRLLFRRGNDFMLVAVVSGQITQNVQNALYRTVKQIDERFGQILKNWDGATKDVAGIKDIIAGLLSPE